MTNGIIFSVCLTLAISVLQIVMRKERKSKDSSTNLYGNLDGKKCRIGSVFFVHRQHRSFLSVYVDDVKMAGHKQNTAPMWKKLMKLVDLDEPTSFLDHIYLGCTQRECKPNKDIIEQYKEMFESC